MNKEKKEEVKTTQEEEIKKSEKEPILEETPKMRQIVIEFDNKSINLKIAEVSSHFELQGIFDSILKQIKQ